MFLCAHIKVSRKHTIYQLNQTGLPNICAAIRFRKIEEDVTEEEERFYYHVELKEMNTVVPFMENYVFLLQAPLVSCSFGVLVWGSCEDRLDVKSICISATLHHIGLS